MNGPWFLERFDRAKEDGDGRWRARCPVCGSDRQLSIREGRDRYVLNAFCKCDRKIVLEEAGLRFADLQFTSTTQRASFAVRPLRGGCTSPGTSVTLNPSFHRGEVEHLLQLHEEGKIDALPAVELPKLPDDATEPMRRVAAFFAHVHALRSWAGMEPEAPFAGDWVAAKLCIPPVTVWRSLRRLEAAGVLQGAGSLPGRDGRRGPKMYVVGEIPNSNVVPFKGRRAA